ncbi:MAG: helix-hairpin-helix domain-containing protein [Marinobacterium sp.]|nr:helix-hairpin-helix domain-containing protein [Marinobacterium sp.]
MRVSSFAKGLVAALLFSLTPLSMAEPIDINTADVEQLSTLSGIGQKKAHAIIRYRDEHGRFASVEELANVRGIGPATVARNQQRIQVKGVETAAAE